MYFFITVLLYSKSFVGKKFGKLAFKIALAVKTMADKVIYTEGKTEKLAGQVHYQSPNSPSALFTAKVFQL